VPEPDVDPGDARLELCRRYLHVFGPGTPSGFAQWAGIGPAGARAAFGALAPSLTAVRTPVGEGWILRADTPAFLTPAGTTAAPRLLPSGDAYFLLWGADRELLVPDAGHRGELWTPRVWPGALLVDGEIVGTWRRAQADVAIAPWRPVSRSERDAVETEAATLPLPGVAQVRVSWDA
jgi:hypothetical protein